MIAYGKEITIPQRRRNPERADAMLDRGERVEFME